ncbi:MAG: ABC transporter substrate-binding protein [Bacillota bacterium]
MSRFLKCLFFITIIILLPGCINSENTVEKRKEFVNNQENDIIIALPGPVWLMRDATNFIDGVNMAVEEINSSGGINGRVIKTVVTNDKASFMEGSTIAQRFAENPEITAVIGHWNSDVTIPVSTIYENSQLLLLSPIVANNKLIDRNYDYIIQNIPSDGAVGQKMALYAKNKGYENIAIYYDDNSYGKGLANAFEKASIKNGIKIVDRVSNFKNKLEFDNSLAKWKAFDYDAVFVADSMPGAGEFIKMLRKENNNIPILGGDGLDLSGFIKDLGSASEGVTMPTFLNPVHKREELQAFKEKFTKEYKKDTDIWAIQGYESIYLLAYAIEKGGSSTSVDISHFLKNMKSFNGVLSDISFRENGSIKGRKIFIKTVKNGTYKYLD